MSKWTKSPVYKINAFITKNLREEGIIPAENAYVTELSGIADPVALLFITPSQQSAESTTPYDDNSDLDGFVDLPFGTYTMTVEPVSDRTYLSSGQISYIFYTADIEKLIEIVNYVVDLCKREEYTAADLNDYIVSDTENKFDFKTINIQNAVGPMEAESANGRHSFLVVITFDCIYESENNTTPENQLKGPFSGKQNMWH